MSLWRDDLRHGLRGLLAHKGSYGFAVAILACGLGLAIAMWCVVDAVLLRQLPFPNAERLVQVRELTEEGRAINVTQPNAEDLTRAVPLFERTAIYAFGRGIVTTSERASSVMVSTVGGDLFAVMGESPMLGRSWSASGWTPEVVISHELWRGQLQGRADVLGSALRVDEVDYTVVGVMPEGFGFPARSMVWKPVDPASFNGSRSAHNWRMLALLTGADDLVPAQQQAQALAAQLVDEHGKDMTARGFDVTPMQQVVGENVRSALQVLAVGVAFLLLIAVSNALNLLLAQALGRRREYAVRSALGATRARLWRQRLAENTLVVGAAWLLGLLIAALAVRVLVDLAGNALPRTAEMGLTSGIVLASGLLALVTALVLTVAGQRSVREQTPTVALREGGRGQTASRSSLRTQGGLLVAQTALTTVLLVAAILIGRSFIGLLSVDPGFKADGAVRIELNQPRVTDRVDALANVARYQALIGELSALPGVTAVGGVNSLPLTGGSNGAFWDHTFTRFDQPAPDPIGYAEFRAASAGYLDAVGIPLLRGRDFGAADRADGEHVALISERAARATWGDADPIGQRIQFGNMDGDVNLLTIVGVVGDVRESGLAREPDGVVYVNAAQRPIVTSQFNVVVRTQLPLASLMPVLRDRLEGTVASMPYALYPLSEVRADSLAQQRFNLVLLAVFAGTALVLAASGLYALMAFSVGQRGGEFAVRQALGASAAGIGALVIRRGLVIAVIGTVLGLLISLATSRLVASLLYGVPPGDPLSYVLVVATLLMVAIVACLAPALHATRVTPATALQ